MEASYSVQHEEAEITAEVTHNYELMISARAEGNPTLEQTFEQRMNSALDSYLDLARYSTRLLLEQMPEGA